MIVVRARAAVEALTLGHLAEVPIDVVERLARSERTCQVIALLRLGIEESIDREAIEREGDRIALAHDRLDRERCRVVVVIVAAAAVAAELVELADLVAVAASVVERVEDRDAVGGKRHRTLHERALAMDGLVGELGLQRDLPGVRAGVGLRQRHLLLP